MFEPFPYQREGVEFLSRTRFALLYDEQGVGKSLQALLAAKPPVLVICPKYLTSQWADLIREQMGMEPVVISKETRQAGLFTICSYERILLHEGEINTLIVDEATYIKNPKSKRSKQVLEISKKAARIYALTGTPIINRPIDLWPLLLLLRRRSPREFFPWAVKYCAGYQHKWGWDFTGASNIDKLRDDLSKFGLRRTKLQVLPDLPPKRYSVIRVDSSKEVQKTGDALADFLLQGGEVQSAEGIGYVQALRVASALCKVEAVDSWLTDYLAGTDSKVVVFCGFKAPLEELCGKRTDTVLVTGDVKDHERSLYLDAFKGASIRVCAITYGVGQYGLNLQHADTVILMDLPWTPAEMEQAEDRVHRMGQTKPVTIVRFISDHPIEAVMLEGLDAKKSVIEMFNTGTPMKLKWP